jgi:hypothetical protein
MRASDFLRESAGLRLMKDQQIATVSQDAFAKLYPGVKLYAKSVGEGVGLSTEKGGSGKASAFALGDAVHGQFYITLNAYAEDDAMIVTIEDATAGDYKGAATAIIKSLFEAGERLYNTQSKELVVNDNANYDAWATIANRLGAELVESVAEDSLNEFVDDRGGDNGGGNDGRPKRNNWTKFIAALDPEIRKLGFARSKDPDYNTKNLTVYFKHKNQFQFTTVSVRVYPRDKSQIYWNCHYHDLGQEAEFIGNGLVPMNTAGVAQILVNVENILEPNQNLNESTFRDHEEQLRDFIKWCVRKLDIQQALPKIRFQDAKEGPDQHRTGYYDDNDDIMWIYTGNRNLIDIMRTVAHELAHRKQHEDNRVHGDQAYPGSPIEQEADAVAGYLMKLYGKQNPEIIE